MIISFNRPELTDLESAFSKEWVELDGKGTYASSTILGLNTRKKHGLFLISTQSTNQPLLILSHLQEEVFLNKESIPIYNVEYGNHLIFEGLKHIEKFNLDPFPTFIFSYNGIRIEKSLCLLRDKPQLVLRYHFNGLIPQGSRLVIRPFFAFRSTDAQVNPEIFENTEVFILGKQFRFLPNPEFPEVFMQYSDGQFINNPMWYHNFVYRRHPDSDKKPEDLLNPGFFEYTLHNNSQLFLSISLNESDPDQLKNLMEKEKERRSVFLRASAKRNEKENYIFGKVHHFLRLELGKNRFFSSNLFDHELHLSVHLLIITRLLQSGIEKSEIIKFYDALVFLLKNYSLEELFQGMVKEVKIDAATPFLVIRFLYLYHQHHEKGEAMLTSIQIMLEILELIRRNKLLFYKLKSHNLLERQYRKSDLQPKSDHEVFYPLRQNFVLNVLWYNSLHMVLELADLKKVRVRRYHRWVKKIKQHFYQQYVRGVVANPYQAIEEYGYAFHPSMIFALTFPLPLLEEKPAQIFYRLLIKQFLNENGITFPLRSKDRIENVYSPILIGDYLDGWQKLMKDKDFLLQYFQNISKHFESELSHGVLGYISSYQVADGVASPNKDNNPSGIACSEILYFFHRLREISKR